MEKKYSNNCISGTTVFKNSYVNKVGEEGSSHHQFLDLPLPESFLVWHVARIACHVYATRMTCLSVTLVDWDSNTKWKLVHETVKCFGYLRAEADMDHSILWSQILLRKTSGPLGYKNVDFCDNLINGASYTLDQYKHE